jgi:lipoate-protein ligase A
MTDNRAHSDSWLLIVDGPLDGTANMEVDRESLARVEASTVPLTILRFYGWTRPTVSVGRNQKPERAVDLAYCSAHGIDVVFRPTGGRAVLHDRELTYAIASNAVDVFGGGTIYETYRRISIALAEGYRRLGLDVVVAPDTTRPDHDPDRDPPCFVSPSRYELMSGGRKIAGSAQRRLRRGFQQHGSMPIECDFDEAARVLMVDRDALRNEMAGMSEFLTSVPGRGTLVEVFTRAFEKTFGIRPGTLKSRKSSGLSAAV